MDTVIYSVEVINIDFLVHEYIEWKLSCPAHYLLQTVRGTEWNH